MMPIVRNPHANNVQRRVSTSQPSLRRPVTSVATAKENGTVKPTKPRYKKTGWKAMSGVVLQKRVRARTVGGHLPDNMSERVRRASHEGEEEDGDAKPDQAGPRHEGVSGPLAEHERHGGQVAAEDQRPEQDRALKGRPHAGDGVEQRRFPAVVGGNEGDREVVREATPAPWRQSK